MNSNFKLSVVLPCYNEEGNIISIHSELSKTLHNIPTYEIIFVNDGSSDNTLKNIKSLSEKDQRIKYISFSRNFGHQNALKAGMDKATGDCVISMDSDMQHPPHLIHEMINKWQEGFEVVYTIRKESQNLAFIKKLTSKLFYRLLNSLTYINISDGAADFRLLDRKVINELKNYHENYLFLRGLIAWIGFKQVSIEYTEESRLSGDTKYTFRKMLNFALAGITSFSIKPLRLSIAFGVIIAGFAFIYAIFAIYQVLFTNKTVPGWSSILVSVLFLGGIQLIMIGILGEYLGKLFLENKRRPNYIISESNIVE